MGGGFPVFNKISYYPPTFRSDTNGNQRSEIRGQRHKSFASSATFALNKKHIIEWRYRELIHSPERV